MERYEVIVVGAGLHGLAMAKTFLEVSPSAHILIVDQSRSVGGCWAAERLYPGLKTNNLVGSYEFSDFPMEPERYGLKRGEHIPGPAVHKYFHDFATNFDLYSHMLLTTKVVAAKLFPSGTWEVTLHINPTASNAALRTVFTEKLVFATGITSQPYLPSFSGQEDFQGIILHPKDLASRAATFQESDHTVVVGGNKSAWDACYMAALSGALVDMIIRPSGGGPSYVWPASFRLFGFKTSLARLSLTRLFTCFDPSPLADAGPFALFRRFLHRTTIGQIIVTSFWRLFDAMIKGFNGYDKHPELRKLKPWITPFWMGNSLSIHNYETDWFGLVRDGKIRIHIADVTLVSKSQVYLSDGTVLDADTLVYCTGWQAKPSVILEPCDTAIGFPTKAHTADTQLEEYVTKAIYQKIPYLRTLARRESNAPGLYSSIFPRAEGHAARPYQLHRFCIPCQPSFLENRNLAFIGAHCSIHAALVAQAQALWITAFLLGKLKHLDHDNMSLRAIKYDSVYQTLYGTIRRPQETGGSGQRYPDLVFDSLCYVDSLLRDLQLKTRRKTSLLWEIFEPYRLSDYRGLVQEWKLRLSSE